MGRMRKLFEKVKDNQGNARWLLAQSRGTKKYIFGFLVISTFSMLFSLVSQVAGKYVVDAAIDERAGFQLQYILIMLGTTLVSIFLGVVSNLFSSYVNEKFAFSVRAVMFDRVQRSNWKKLSGFHTGDMLSRLTSDIDNIASNIIGLLPNLIVAVLQLVMILIIVLKTDPMLALIGLIAGPLGILISVVFRKPFMKYQTELRQSQSEYYTFFQESLGNLGVVKAFETEERNNARFQKLRSRRLKIVMKSARLSSLMSTSSRLVYSMAYVIAFCWCAYQLQTNASYTYGTMTLFLGLVSRIQASVQNLGGVVPKLYSMLVCAKRVREITEQEPELAVLPLPVPEQVGLRVKNVSFTYENETVLKDISFEIPPKSRVGIIGSSGAGKTTLIRLLLALVAPDSGTLEFTREAAPSEPAAPATRRLLSYVPQGNTLITGTVRENLQIGNPDATDAELWRVLDLADAADFVRRDPLGLDLRIQEGSGGLSAGQAQRIGIARALIRNRPVLILDEATSALDEMTERRIFERVISECGKTCFIITHRSSMLKYCDCVLEINDDGTAHMR